MILKVSDDMYDVVVIGGGHAGVEAALVSARLNKKTILISGNLNMVSFMPCNPSMAENQLKE